MTKETEIIALDLGCRIVLKEMTDDERVEFFANIRKGYCLYCGREEMKNWHCQCENDA